MGRNQVASSMTAGIKYWRSSLSGFLRKQRKRKLNYKLPFKGYTPSPTIAKYVDILTDDDLVELNDLLDWNCFTVDSHGRRFGKAAWGGKRNVPETIPDRRIVMLHDRFDLSDKHVLEVGCFEGIHTLGLLMFAERVTAVDARIYHVVKTNVRCAMYGYTPTVFKYDVESIPSDASLLQADLMHHVGVLYHLKDPVGHLLELGKYINSGVMLDTHYALPEEATETYSVQGNEYFYKRYVEHGKKEAFSGMYEHSKWLLLEDIVACLKKTGFDRVEIIEKRDERNGPRVLLFAERT
jgi:tRNA (mo5U34)-methyltransferase